MLAVGRRSLYSRLNAKLTAKLNGGSAAGCPPSHRPWFASSLLSLLEWNLTTPSMS